VPEVVSFHFGLPEPDLLQRVKAQLARKSSPPRTRIDAELAILASIEARYTEELTSLETSARSPASKSSFGRSLRLGARCLGATRAQVSGASRAVADAKRSSAVHERLSRSVESRPALPPGADRAFQVEPVSSIAPGLTSARDPDHLGPTRLGRADPGRRSGRGALFGLVRHRVQTKLLGDALQGPSALIGKAQV
jgi:hypothetical protein